MTDAPFTREPTPDYAHTGLKSDVRVPEWAEHFEIGDTIRWDTGPWDSPQESEIVGFSTRHGGIPVIAPPEEPEEHPYPNQLECFAVDKESWIPRDRTEESE